MTLSPLEFASAQQQSFDAASLPAERRAHGHFGTPPPIAKFMASLFGQWSEGELLRVLDPGAGVGILSAAVCEWFAGRRSTSSLYIELWESNRALEPFLEQTMRHCQRYLDRSGRRLDYVIRTEDFVLANRPKTLFNDGPLPSFHLAILNPPYFKLRKDSPHAREMAHVVHGQPNIYSLFMALAAELLAPEGQFVAITPRSYFNGPYFKRFRRWFFDRMSVRQIHLFDSRTDAFREEEVLQENVILLAERDGAPRQVVLSSSAGRDLKAFRSCELPYRNVVADAVGDHIVRVTTDAYEQQLIGRLDAFSHRLRSFGFEISTGPVVTFRATEFLRTARGAETAPLLWMHNVRPFRTQWTEKPGKPSHIAVNSDSIRLLVPAKRYVLLKRFTAKEEKRRLVAGVFEPDACYTTCMGLENHLNYIYKKGSELSKAEAIGLAAYLNCTFIDRYFRAVSGNTQVNAAEIRSLPLPDLEAIVRIGCEIGAIDDFGAARIDAIVSRAIGLPDELVQEFTETVQ